MNTIFHGLTISDAQGLQSHGPAADVRLGLGSEPKWLSGLYFYDPQGLRLFEKITRMAEYPVTREEKTLLHKYAEEIASTLGDGGALLELGVGASAKIVAVLRAWHGLHQRATYCPNDVDEETLQGTIDRIGLAVGGIKVTPIPGEFYDALTKFRLTQSVHRTVAMLGGSIGNVEPPEQIGLVAAMKDAAADGSVLIGFDAVRNEQDMLMAYDDPAGTTAAFNRNLLVNLNRLLGGNNDPLDFEHEAVWNKQRSRIELRLVAKNDTMLRFAAIDCGYSVVQGEGILTQVSYKYRPQDIEQLAKIVGMSVRNLWTTGEGRFMLCRLVSETP